MAAKKSPMDMADAIKTVTARSTDPVMELGSKQAEPRKAVKTKLVSFRMPLDLLRRLDTWLGTKNPDNKNRTQVVIEAIESYIK
ncbi:MAG: hypothetical protein IIT33_01640 [Prevotella sp.]|nr:hypothetical protein [Prevotella sp.]MBQ5557074.1 hypothetical protein [Aeriscardovia sp.]